MEEKIKELIKNGESEKVEFKESLSVKEEIGESVSAFANSEGGKILVGISDFGDVRGIQVGKKSIEELANYIKQNTDNHIYPSIKVEIANGKNVLVLEVKECTDKPVFFRGKAYKRVGKSNHFLSASEIRKLAKEGTKDYWDEKICEGASLKDIDEEKVMWFLEQREKHRNMKKEMKISFNTFLENIKAIKNNKPTNAGILFFGKDPLKFFSSAQLRAVRIKGKEVSGLIIDRIDCNGTLWQMVEQIEEFLKKHINFIGLRTEKSFQREDKFDIPIKALRELIINALIHRDYETTADARIFIFDDGVEVINPGHFPKGVTPAKPLHSPVNRTLSQYMYDIGFIEKYGSGIINVRNLLKENGNKDLEYVLHELETKAVIYSQIFKEKDLERDLEKDLENLGEKQRRIIKEIKKNPKITQEELSRIVGINEKNIRNNISKLKKKGLIKRVGPDKGGYWEVIEKNEDGN